LRVLPKPRLLALAGALTAALVVLSLAATTTLASSPLKLGGNPPKFALLKGETVIQKGLKSSTCWDYWKEIEESEAKAGAKAEGAWQGWCADYFYDFPRRAVLVHAGSTLHIRLYKPQRPDGVQLAAYPGFDEGSVPGPAGNPIGKRQRLHTTLRPVQRDDETVAWDVFFRVNQSERHYYLDIWVVWERVPGTHISHGDRSWTFHVKTR
jgi:hypothetical protein